MALPERNEIRITPGWLTDCLRRSGDLPEGEVVAVLPTDPPGEAFMSFEVVCSPGTPETVPRHFMLKANTKGGGYGLRESALYGDIAPAMSAPPVPRCFQVDLDPETGSAFLLLEDLSYTHRVPADVLETPLAHPQFEAIINELLKLHAHWWEHPRIGRPDFVEPIGDIVGMAQAASPDAIRQTCARIADRALPAFFDTLGDRVPRAWQTACEKAVAAWPDLFIPRTDRGTALTLIHGDPHPWNVFLPVDPQAHRPRIVDWELCCRGLGVYDLAYLLIKCRLAPEARQRLESLLLPHYHSRLLECGVQEYTLNACRQDYRLSILANLLPPLLWRRIPDMEAAMAAFEDWDCAELLG